MYKSKQINNEDIAIIIVLSQSSNLVNFRLYNAKYRQIVQ